MPKNPSNALPAAQRVSRARKPSYDRVMGHRFLLVATLVFILCADLRADTDVQILINQLAHPDAGMREQAAEELTAMGADARPALRKALKHPRPAIADAARELLMKLPLSRPTDPIEAVRLLSRYGELDPDQRTERLHNLLVHPNADVREVGLRVIPDESTDDVIWRALASAPIDETWKKLLKDTKPDGQHPAIVHLLARIAAENDDDARADELYTLMLDREVEHPTATADQLSFAISQLREHARTKTQIARVAKYLSHLIALGGDEATSQEPLLDLLLLHARNGPLPGLMRDLAMAQRNSNLATSLATAELARRLGVGTPAQVIADSALSTHNLSTEQAWSLHEGGFWLMKAGNRDLAERALMLCALTADDGADYNFIAGNANLRLYDLYSASERHLEAAQRLDKALDLFGDNVSLQITRGKHAEAWPVNEARASAIWHLYKHAIQQKDPAEAQRRAVQLMNHDTADMSIFLEVLPTLEEHAKPNEIEGYFDRCFNAQMAKLKETPDDPLRKNDLAWLCARAHRKLDIAYDNAKAAVAAKPNEAAYLDTLAEVCFRLGKISEAIRLEEKALSLQPDQTFMKEQLDRFRQAATTRPTD